MTSPTPPSLAIESQWTGEPAPRALVFLHEGLGSLAQYHADVDGAFRGWNRAWLDPAFRRWNLEAYLPRITVPTLVVQGTADQYGTLAQVRAIERQLAGPVETMLVEGAGHAPFRDAPDAVHERIADFVCAMPAS